MSDCQHSWVAGMMRVHPEDVEAIASVREVTCERCGKVLGRFDGNRFTFDELQGLAENR